MTTQIITHYYVKKTIIHLRLTLDGKRSEISTHKKIDPAKWNRVTERLSGESDYAKAVNASLNGLLSKVENYCINMDLKGERINLQEIINELKGTSVNQMTLFKAFEHHIANITKLIGIDFTTTTVKRYTSSFNNLKRYLKNKDVRLCDLDYKFIADFYTYLKTTEKLQHNSTTNVIKNLGRIINISITNNWLTSNPFKDFSCNYVNSTRQYLTESEIDTLVNKVFGVDRLTKVRDVFVFQIYTGLFFTDMETLTPDNIEMGVDGKQWIVINRKKTGVRSSIPILPRAKEILKKYDYKLPVCTNQRMNGYLKEIADLCNITKTLTTHIGRHTFATTITLSRGVPIETVSKMLGHTDIRTTQIYAKITDKKTADDMKSLM